MFSFILQQQKEEEEEEDTGGRNNTHRKKKRAGERIAQRLFFSLKCCIRSFPAVSFHSSKLAVQ